jgi:hypothetical protein
LRVFSRAIADSNINEALYKIKVEGVRYFHLHDLRRAARTLLGKLGVDVIIAEKCLNHRLGGLLDVYDRGDYLSERRKALELLASFLVACEQGRPWNVKPLRSVAWAEFSPEPRRVILGKGGPHNQA